MPFVRPTRADLVARVEADFATRLGLGALIPRSNLKGWSAVEAGLSHGLHGHIDYGTKQILPDTADPENLERWGTIFGINRKAATFAGGGLTFTGTDGSLIPAQTVIQRADGERYETQAAVTIAAGVALVQIQVQVAGVAGNSDPATTLSLASPIAGVETSATVDGGGLTKGADRESNEELLARILNRLQNPPQGGAPADYVIWALEVAAVTRAWVLPGHLGLGTVGVTFVLDGSATIVPTAPKVQEVADYIATRAPATATVIVFAPGELSLDLTIAVLPNNADVQAAVTASLDDMLRRETSPGKVIPLSKISEAISSAQGELSHVLTIPAADVAPSPGEIVTLGTITFT